MAVWGPAVAEELRRDVRFALTFKVGKSLRPLTDTERDMVADAIVDHIKLCNWKVEGGRHGADLRISQEDRSRTGERRRVVAKRRPIILDPCADASPTG